MKPSYIILIVGTVMLLGGNFLGNTPDLKIKEKLKKTRDSKG